MVKTEHRPELIIIAGPNGSGKTSVTQKFLHHEWAEGTVYINPDKVVKDALATGIRVRLSSAQQTIVRVQRSQSKLTLPPLSSYINKKGDDLIFCLKLQVLCN